MGLERDKPPAKLAFPPLIYLSCLAAGLVLDFLAPAAVIPDALQYWLGGALILLGILPMPFVMTRFRKAGTSFESRGQTTAVLREGPFRYSRNPAYLSMSVLYLGLGVAIDSLWILGLFVVGFVLMDAVVVTREEAHLERQFGDEYRAYKASVRRWI